MAPSTTAADTGEWTEERIRATLASEPFDYQAIELPFGIKTGGHDRKPTADSIFTGDWAGQSVLDVGSSLGYFLFEARRHGAGRCVGMDLSSDNIRRAKTLADILKLPVEFQLGDIDAGPVGERFDNVLCLNVLHHLVDPILGLNRLIDAASRRLVLEVATVGSHDRRKLGLGWLQSSVLEKLPAIVVGRGTAGEGIKQFYLTIAAIENLLRYRRGCFASVEIKPSGFKNRFLVVAEKRRVDRLLVVSGMTGSRSAELAAQIAQGKDLGLSPQIDALAGAPVLKAADYHKPQRAHLPALIVDYDFLRPHISGALTFNHDPATDLFAAAKQTTFLTVWEKPEASAERLSREAEQSSGAARKQIKRALENISSARDALTRYREWVDFTTGKGPHWILTQDDGGGQRLVPAQEWLGAMRAGT